MGDLMLSSTHLPPLGFLPRGYDIELFPQPTLLLLPLSLSLWLINFYRAGTCSLLTPLVSDIVFIDLVNTTPDFPVKLYLTFKELLSVAV